MGVADAEAEIEEASTPKTRNSARPMLPVEALTDPTIISRLVVDTEGTLMTVAAPELSKAPKVIVVPSEKVSVPDSI